MSRLISRSRRIAACSGAARMARYNQLSEAGDLTPDDFEYNDPPATLFLLLVRVLLPPSCLQVLPPAAGDSTLLQ